MRKKILKVIMILFVAGLMIPIPLRLKDGGTVKYQAVLYSISDVHRLAPTDNDVVFENGIIIEILGKEVFNNVAAPSDACKPVEGNDAVLDDSIDLMLPTATALREPLKLIVSTSERSIDALIGTTAWMYFGDDGEEMAIMGDSRHPLLLKESMPVLDLVPTYMSNLDPLGASLQFGVEPYIICPDKVTVCCWQEKCWGDTKAESEEVSVHMENGNVFIQLKEGNYIYEVIAEWTEPRSVSGSVCYSFCTEKPSMEE